MRGDVCRKEGFLVWARGIGCVCRPPASVRSPHPLLLVFITAFDRACLPAITDHAFLRNYDAQGSSVFTGGRIVIRVQTAHVLQVNKAAAIG